MYPDILREENKADLPPEKWVAFRITVHAPNGLPSGKHSLQIELRGENGACIANTTYELEVLDAELPESDFPVAHWMHYDSIANY